MIVNACNFNPLRDQNKVIPGRSINIRSAFETGVIQSTGVESEFNQIDDVNRIGNRIEDEFDAVVESRRLQQAAYDRRALARSKAKYKTETKTESKTVVNPSGDVE